MPRGAYMRQQTIIGSYNGLLSVLYLSQCVYCLFSPREQISIELKYNDFNKAWRMELNPLHTKFNTGNKNIYSHFMTFHHINTTKEVEIRPSKTIMYTPVKK